MEIAILSRNPVIATDPMKHTRKEQQIRTAQETAQFLGTVEGHRLSALFYLALRMGCAVVNCWRLSGVTSREIFFTCGVLFAHVRGELIISTPKTEKGTRRVTLSPAVLDALELHRQRQAAERAYIGLAWHELGLIFTKQDGG